eukprot:scaffold8301_cov184-Cylindrotheca_fusiformis.AAC.7
MGSASYTQIYSHSHLFGFHIPFRWRNADKDMLACSTCNAALAITLPSGLSTKVMERICDSYREKLALAHKQNCPFKIDGEQFLRLQNRNGEDLIPPYLASVLPQDCVELLEKPFPSALLLERIKQLDEHCPPTYEYPKLEVSGCQPDETDSIKEMAATRLATSESVGILVILGWRPTDQKTLESAPSVALGCRLCYSWMDLKLVKKSSDKQSEVATLEETRPSKKSKLSRYCNPFEAHRHYCPYVCGFPERLSSPKKPIWKTLVSRLQQEDTISQQVALDLNDQSISGGDDSADRIQKILRAAIARKKIDLSSQID